MKKISNYIISLTVALVFIMMFNPMIVKADNTLYPSKSSLNLVIGSDGSGIHITYSGAVSPPSGAASCSVSVSFISDYGLTPKYDGSAYCDKYGYVSIPITFTGIYNGKGGYYAPISLVSVNFYDANNTFLGTTYLTVNPITINSVNLSVSSSISVLPNSMKLSVSPSSPTVGQTITIYTKGDANIVVQANQPPDVSAQLLLYYYQPNGVNATKPFTIYSGKSTAVVTVSSIDLSSPVEYQILSSDRSFVVSQGETNSQPPENAVNIQLMFMQPYIVAPLGNTTPNAPVKVYGGVYVFNFPSSAQLMVTLLLGNSNNNKSPTVSITKSGLTTIEVDNVNPSVTSGQYSVAFSMNGLSTNFVVPFSLSTTRTYTGGLISKLFYYTFMAVIGASFTATIAGFILRRTDMMSSGLLGLAASVLVFMIPTIISYAISMLFATGVPDPEHVGNVNLLTLGDAVDRSITFTESKALWSASFLRDIAIILLGIIAALGAVSVLSGIIGWLTGGALSQFAGMILGEFGSQLIIMSMYSFLVSYVLEVLAYIYPIVLNVVLILLFFTILIEAMYAAYTGNISQIYHPIIQFSILILTIMLVPPIFQTIDDLKSTVGSIPMPPPINMAVQSIPNPFFWIAATLIQIGILVIVMYMAFQRMMTILGGATS